MARRLKRPYRSLDDTDLRNTDVVNSANVATHEYLAHDDRCLDGQGCAGLGIDNSATANCAPFDTNPFTMPSFVKKEIPFELPSGSFQAAFPTPLPQYFWQAMDRMPVQPGSQMPGGQMTDFPIAFAHQSDLGPPSQQTVQSCADEDISSQAGRTTCSSCTVCSKSACDSATACDLQDCPRVGIAPDVAHAAGALFNIGNGDPGVLQTTNFGFQQNDHLGAPSPMGTPSNNDFTMHSHDQFYNSLGLLGQHIQTHPDKDYSEIGWMSMPDLNLGGFCHMPQPFPYDAYPIQTPFNAQVPHDRTQECGVRIDSTPSFIKHLSKEHPGQLQSWMESQIPSRHPTLPQTSFHRAPSPATLATDSPSEGVVPDLFDGSGNDNVGTYAKEILTPQPSVEPSPSKTNPAPAQDVRCHWCCGPGSDEICGAVFKTPFDLQLHVVSRHCSPLPKEASGYSCHWKGCSRFGEHCFPQRSKLQRHVQSHTGHKPYKCDQCGFMGSTKQSLDQHKNTHTGDRPYKCPECGKSFAQKSALTMHRRTHSKEKPLECPLCGKRFAESSNLSKHKRIHEPKGRFKCEKPGCGRQFHRVDQLRRHKCRGFEDDGKGEERDGVENLGGEDHSRKAATGGENKRQKLSPSLTPEGADLSLSDLFPFVQPGGKMPASQG